MHILRNIRAALLISISVLLVSATAYADTGLIKNIDVVDTWKNNYNASNWIELANVRAGISMYGDVEVPIKTLSKSLLGADFIQTAYGSQSFLGQVLATFSLTHNAFVYIAHARSIQVKPAWLKSYTKTTYTITNTDGEVFDIYSRRYNTGATVTLGNNGDTDAAMYMVIVKSVGGMPVMQKPQGKVFDAAKYGAVGDNKTINTKSLQTAIDACTAAGGGSVYIHGGIFMTGTLIMKDNVTLFVEAGSVLRGSQKPGDYPEIIPSLPSYRRTESLQLIYAEKAKNIGITGGGIIDGYSLGNNRPWSNKLTYKRPRLIRMFECKGINVTHITLMRTVYWTQYYEGCEDFKEDNVRVHCYTGMDNQDGIDISGCKNVQLSNYYVISGDDAVCIKAMSMKPTENLNIYNIFVRYSNCHGVKIGTETHGPVKHVRVKNVTVVNARYGNGIEAADGSTVEDVVYEDFKIGVCSSPIFLTLTQRGRVFEGGPAVAPISKMKDIVLRNITNTDITSDDSHSGSGLSSIFVGLPGQNIENVRIENCNLLYIGGRKNPDLANYNPAEAPKAYPEFNLIGIGPAYGLYFRHVRGVTVANTRVRYKYIDARPAIVLDDVKDYALTNVSAESSPMTAPYLIWHKQDGQLKSKTKK